MLGCTKQSCSKFFCSTLFILGSESCRNNEYPNFQKQLRAYHAPQCSFVKTCEHDRAITQCSCYFKRQHLHLVCTGNKHVCILNTCSIGLDLFTVMLFTSGRSVPNVFIAFCLHGVETFDCSGLYVVINIVVTLTCTESWVCTRNQQGGN